MLNQLTIQQFRNIQALQVPLFSGATWVVGDNAQGKTSLLEAAYLLSTGMHLRGSTLGHLVRQGDAYAKLTGKFDSHEAEWRIVLDQATARWQKKYLENGVERRFSSRLHMTGAVLFEPQDVRLFSSSPSRRRHWLDELVGRLYVDYRRALLRYERFLKSRNQLLLIGLQGGKVDGELLNILSTQLADVGAYLWLRRREVFAAILPKYQEWLERLWGKPFVCEMVYKQSLTAALYSSQPDEFEDHKKQLQKQYEHQLSALNGRERRVGRTLSGPHLDDIIPFRDGVELSEFASRGELRCLSLALKLAELDLLTDRLEQPPLLLLDDVLSELDANHRSLLGEIIRQHQTIITATEVTVSLPTPEQSIFRMVAGVLRQEAA